MDKCRNVEIEIQKKKEAKRAKRAKKATKETSQDFKIFLFLVMDKWINAGMNEDTDPKIKEIITQKKDDDDEEEDVRRKKFSTLLFISLYKTFIKNTNDRIHVNRIP